MTLEILEDDLKQEVTQKQSSTEETTFVAK